MISMENCFLLNRFTVDQFYSSTRQIVVPKIIWVLSSLWLFFKVQCTPKTKLIYPYYFNHLICWKSSKFFMALKPATMTPISKKIWECFLTKLPTLCFTLRRRKGLKRQKSPSRKAWFVVTHSSRDVQMNSR